MLTFEQIIRDYGEDFMGWRTNIYSSRCTGGESFEEVKIRAFNQLTNIAQSHDGKNLLIATHAGVIRALITEIKNLNPD